MKFPDAPPRRHLTIWKYANEVRKRLIGKNCRNILSFKSVEARNIKSDCWSCNAQQILGGLLTEAGAWCQRVSLTTHSVKLNIVLPFASLYSRTLVLFIFYIYVTGHGKRDHFNKFFEIEFCTL